HRIAEPDSLHMPAEDHSLGGHCSCRGDDIKTLPDAVHSVCGTCVAPKGSTEPCDPCRLVRQVNQILRRRVLKCLRLCVWLGSLRISFTCHTRWQGSCRGCVRCRAENLLHLPRKGAGVVTNHSSEQIQDPCH